MNYKHLLGSVHVCVCSCVYVRLRDCFRRLSSGNNRTNGSMCKQAFALVMSVHVSVSVSVRVRVRACVRVCVSA